MLLVLTGLSCVLGTLYLYVKFKIPWLAVDLKMMRYFASFGFKFARYKKQRMLPIDIFEETADTYVEKSMIIYKDVPYSFREMERMANKMAHVALGLGFGQGDTVAIMMYNEPMFIWTWLGFQKVGIEVAFLNFNQRKKTLLHSITTCGAKAVFLSQGSELYAALQDIASDIENVDLFTFEASRNGIPKIFRSLAADLMSAAEDRISRDYRLKVDFRSPNCFIFTSGTTGLPKPAIVSHERAIIGHFIFNYCDACADDILYEPLPLYHSAGSILGVGSVMRNGMTMVLAEKFSARKFFEECHRHKVTIIHYVGEMCRYLVNSPETPYDKNHSVRVALGNGLRKDIWTEFKKRFHIGNIVEFYGATELPFGFVNIFNTVGAVGRLSPLLKTLFSVVLVKFDGDSDQPLRNEMGRCILSEEGEPGLLMIKLNQKISFDGYKNKEDASKKKIICDVFNKGDKFITSGDLFYIDSDYNVYFYDRLGDTFRWKGENVSSTEVANIISELPFISDTCVYGVSIAGCEGRAGMAAITLAVNENKMPTPELIEKIGEHCLKELAGYAIPRFLRFRETLEITSTFKQLKLILKQEEFDVDRIKESLYFFDCQNKKYILLDKANEIKIRNQELKM